MLTVTNGQSRVDVTSGSSSTKLTFTSLARATGSSGTVNFTLSSGNGNLAQGSNGIIFSTAPTLVHGVIPYATVQQAPGTPLELATYQTVSGTTGGITNYSAVVGNSYVTSVNGFTGTGADNVNLSAASSNLAISAPGTTVINSLTLTTTSTTPVVLTINAGSTLQIASGAILFTQPQGGTIGTGVGALTITGGGTLLLGSTATPDGLVMVSPGVTATINVNTFTASNLTVAGGGALILPTANPFQTGTVALAGNSTLTIGSPLSLANATLKLITGTFQTTIAPTAALPNGLVLTNPLAFVNSVVTLGGNGNPITFNGAVALTGTSDTLTINTPITMGGVVTGAAATSLIKQGTGTLVLSGASSTTLLGITDIAAGVINVQSSGGLGSASAGALVVNSGATLQLQAGAVTIAKPLAIAGTGAAGTTGALEGVSGATGNTTTTLSLAVLLLGDTQIGVDAGQVTVGGVISGAGALNKVGPGTLSLGGANTYIGSTTISQGILEANVASALGAITAGTTVNNNATLQLTPAAALTTPYAAEPVTLVGSGDGLNPGGTSNYLLNRGAFNYNANVANTWTGNITLGSPTNTDATIGVSTGILTINGAISGPNNLVTTGPGTLTLGATNTFTGALTVNGTSVTLLNPNTYTGATTINGNAASLTLSSFGSATSTSGVSVAPGATFAINNSAVAVNNRLGASNKANLTLNGATFTLAANSTPGVITTETLGNINLLGGNSVITSTAGSAASGSAMFLNVVGNAGNPAGTLNRVQGATVNFGAPAASAALGSPTNQILFATPPALQGTGTNQIIPYAVTSAQSGVPTDLTTYGTFGITAFASGLGTPANQAYAGTLETALPGSNVKLTGSDALSLNRQVNAILIAAPITLSIGGGTALTVASGQIVTTGAGTSIITGGSLSVGNSEGVLFTNTGATITFDTPITGTNGLTIASGTGGAGPITFGGGNNYTGPTAINGSSVTINSNTVFGSGTLTLTAGTITPNSSVTIANPVVMNNGGITFGATSTTAAINLTGGTQVSGLFNLLTVNTSGGVTFAQPIVDGTAGAGAVNFGGAGTILLAAANTYSGGTTIGQNSTPTVMLSNNSAFGPGTLNLFAGTIVTGGGTVLGQAVSATGATLTNNVLLTGNMTWTGSAPLTFSGPATLIASPTLTINNTTTFAGSIGELGTARLLTMGNTSVGTLVLSGTNTYSGGTTLNSGVLGSAGTLMFSGSTSPSTGPLTSGPLGTGTITLTSGVLQPTTAVTLGNAVSINSTTATTSSSPATLSGGNITFTAPAALTANSLLNVNNTTTFAGPISGAFGLTQEGSGTLQLTAANTYAGATQVLGGTLLVNNLGSLASTAITVDQSGTFTLDNTAINLPDIGLSNLSGRLVNTATLTLFGGTFNFVGNPTFASNETLGLLTLAGGNSTISSSNGSGGTLLTFAGLTRAANTGTVNFVAPSGSAAIGSVSPTGTPINELVFASQAAATATINPGILPLVPTGTTNSAVTITNGGLGYAANQVLTGLTVTGGGGTGGTATATANASGVITSVTITASGSNYTGTATVTIPAPAASKQANATATLSAGTVNAINLAAPNNGGTNYAPGNGQAIVTIAAPPNVTGNITATATANVSAAGVVTGFTITNAGKGYTTAPLVTIALPQTAVTATATVTPTLGVVTGYTVTNPGGGYATPPVITLMGGGGTGASAAATVSGGFITGIAPTPAVAPNAPSTASDGSGYATAPIVSIAAPQLAGQITVNTTIGTPGNILPYAIVTGPTGSVDFATNLNGAVAAFTGYTQGLANAEAQSQALMTANPGSNGVTDLVVEQTGSDTSSVTATATSPGLGIAALLVNSGGPTSISLAGNLALTSGALVTTGSSAVSISGGQISSPAGELILNTLTGSSATIVSPIVSLGLQATATTALATSSGTVFGITVTTPGYGYTTPPNVTISDPTGTNTGATATAILNSSGQIASISVTNVAGEVYDANTTVTIGAPTLESATGLATLGAAVGNTGAGVASIAVTFGGQGYQTPPPVVIGPPDVAGGIQATAVVLPSQLVNGVVTGITVTNPGTGYHNSPFINYVASNPSASSDTLAPPNQTAQAVAQISQGGVSFLNIIVPGTGYSFPPTITFSGGGGSGAAATATVLNGGVVSFTLTSGGSNYSSAPTVMIQAPPATATATATISNSQLDPTHTVVVSGASGYSSSNPPTVTFVGGNPTVPAVARAVVNASGVVTGITFTGFTGASVGSGYQSVPQIVIAPAPAPAMGLTISGGGMVSLPNANALTGISNINGGTVMLGSGGALGTGTINVNAGTIQASTPVTIANPLTFTNSQVNFTGSNAITTTGAVNLSTGTTTLTTNYTNNATTATTIAGIISGSGALTLASGSGSASNPGTFVISGTASTYTGLTFITNQALVKLTGTTTAAANTGLGGAAAAVVNSGSTLQILGIGTGNTWTKPLVLSGSGLAGNGALENVAGVTTWTTGTITLLPSPSGALNSTIGVDAGQLTLSTGAIGGVTDLDKVGIGILQLGGTNTYTGQTNLTTGVLNVASAGALGSVLGGTTVSTGAVLNITATNTITPELLTLNGNGSVNGIGATANTGALEATAAATWSGNIVLNQGTSIGGTAALIVTGNVSGTDLVKTGTSTLTLTANNTFTGQLNILSGTATSTLTPPTGSVVLSNANIYTGVTTVGPGTGLVLNNAGTALNTSAINVNAGAVSLDDTTGNFNLGNRLSSTTPLTFNGGASSGSNGSLNVVGNLLGATTTGTSETLGPITLASGNTQIWTVPSPNSGSTLSVTAASLTRNAGASVNFVGVNAAIGSAFNQLFFTTAPTLTGGAGNGILPYGVISLTSTTTPGDFPTYTASGGIAPFTNYVTSLADATPNSNVKLSSAAALAAGVGTQVINSLVLVGATDLALSGGTLQIASGGVLATGGSTTDIVGNAGSALDFGSAEGIISANNLVVNANITGTGGLTVYGGGTLTLANPNTYSGTTSLGAGTLSVYNNNSIGNGTSPIVFSGGTIQAGASVKLPNPYSLSNSSITIAGTAPIIFTNTGTLQGNNTITVSNTGGVTLQGGLNENPVPGASLILAGGGTVDLPTANTFTGGTTVNGPVVMIGSGSSLGTGTLNLAAGTLIGGAPAVLGGPVSTSATMVPNTILVTGTAFTFNGSTPLIFNGPATLATNNVALTANSPTTFTSPIGEFGGARTLSMVGTGTLSLTSTASTYSGGTTLNTGPVGNVGALAISGTTTALNGVLVSGPLGIGTVTLSSGVLQATGALNLGNTLSLTPSATANSPIVFTGSPITFSGAATMTGTYLVTANNTTTFAAPISGAGTLTVSGTGNLVLTAANTYSGATTVNSGTVTLSGNGTALTSAFTVNQGGTLTLDNTGTNIPDSGSTGRLGNLALTMNGGTFSFLGNPTLASSESLGALTLGTGASTISSTPGAAGNTLFFASLSRATSGGTVNFVAPSGSAAISSTTNTIEIGPTGGTIAGQVAVNSGVSNIIPFATVTGPSGTDDFATNLGGNSIGPFSAYTLGLSNTVLTTTEVVELAASDTTSVTPQGVTVAALKLASGTPLTLAMNGTLQITTGAILTTGGTTATISGGGISPGTPTTPSSELIAVTDTGSALTLNSPINLTPGSTATATAVINNGTGSLASITLTAPGSGYLSAPNVTISGGGPGASGATASTTINSAGQVTGLFLTGPVTTITVDNGGSGYTGTTAAVTISGTGGAAAIANVVNGSINSITITNGGGGYTTPPTITIAKPATGTQATANAAISVGGTGYTQAPVVQIGSPDVQATAIAQLDPKNPGQLQEIDLTSNANGVTSIAVSNGGTGYSAASPPLVTIDPPMTLSGTPTIGGTTATAIAVVNASGVITAINIVSPGSGYFLTPNVTIAGTGGAVATATVSSGGFGAGYRFPPTVTIVGNGQSAAAVANINSAGVITGIVLTNAGSGYSSPPTVIIDPPTLAATANSANDPVSGAILGFTNVVSGEGYLAPPTVTIVPTAGDPGASGATAVASVAGGQVKAINLGNPGFGYPTVPNVVLSAPPAGGVQATAIATVSNNVLTGFIISNPGSGYKSAPTVTVDAPTGTTNPIQATGTATLTTLGQVAISLTGSVTTINVVAGGSGYSTSQTTPPTISITGGGGSGATAVPVVDPTTGAIDSITITNAGSGYITAPTIAINGTNTTAASATSAITTGGTGYLTGAKIQIAPPTLAASATATFNPVNGTINPITDTINVTNGGSGYTNPTVVLTGGGGSGATATATVVQGAIATITLTSLGSGYTSAPTVTINDPTGTGATASAVYDFLSGAGYLIAPAITITSSNGAGSGATAVATLGTGAQAGMITSITVINGSGSGYTANPIITIAQPFSTASGAATPNAGQITGFAATEFGGSGYSTAPAVTIGAPPPGGIQATATAVVNNGSVTLTLTNGGMGYTSPPPVSIAPPPALQATATATVGVDQTISGITVVSQGAGYSGTTAVVLVEGNYALGGSPATAVATISSGKITSIAVGNKGGAGYTTAPTVIIPAPPIGLTFSGGGTVTLPNWNDNVNGVSSVNGGTIILGTSSSLGQGALHLTAGTIEASAPISLVNAITMNNSQLTFAGANPIILGAPLSSPSFSGQIVNGSVDNLVVNYGGSGWSTPPTITNHGGATAVATISKGVITGLVLTNAGSGLTGNPSFSSSSPASFTGAPGATVTLTNNVSITANNLGGVLFGSLISGPGNLTTQGTGTIQLDPLLGNGGTDTFTGVTTVASGNLEVMAASSLGASGAGQGTYVDNGATLQILGNGQNEPFGFAVPDPLVLNGTGSNNNGALQLLYNTDQINSNAFLPTFPARSPGRAPSCCNRPRRSTPISAIWASAASSPARAT